MSPILTFHWLTHPVSASGLRNRTGRSRTRLFLFCFVWEAECWCQTLEKRAAGRGSYILGLTWVHPGFSSQCLVTLMEVSI
jgi:hypothetical protein